MNSWRLSITPRALRDLEKLLKAERDAVQAGIERLAADPSASDIKKLHLEDSEWRLRVGGWRVRFIFEQTAHTIRILRVLARREAYRDR